MKIKLITSQHRRDFVALYECEHCGHIVAGSGYDDRNFHEKVIPAMRCEKCRLTAPENYRPLATRYDDSEIV